MSEGKPKVTVSKTGVRQVTPSQIVNSDVGREQIRRTAESVALRISKATTQPSKTDR